MKTLQFGLLLLFTVTINDLTAQNTYSLNKTATIYDLPGDHFITHFKKNGKAYLQEHDITGTIVWKDSLNNDFALPSIDSVYLQRFGESDKYCVFLQYNNSTDSITVNCSMLSILTHQFQLFRTDVLRSDFSFKTCSVNDSTIYLFTNAYTAMSVLKHDVFSINSNLDRTIIASSDSVKTKPLDSIWGYNFYIIPDGLIEVYNDYGNVYTQKYSLQLQKTATLDSSKYSPEYQFASSIFLHLKDSDSIFSFNYGYLPGFNESSWDVTWFNSQLTTLDSFVYIYNINPPNNFYTVNFNDVVLTNDYIYALATYSEYDGPGYSYYPHLFIYDYQLDLYCDFELDLSYELANELTVLNDKAYVVHNTGDRLELLLIDQCSVAAGINDLGNNTSSSLQLYPNPSDGNFTLKSQHSVQGKEVCVYSVLGQKITRTILLNETENTIELNVKSGVYFIKIVGDDSETVQFVVR